MLEIKCCYSLSHDGGVAWDEFHRLRASVVYNGEDRVEALRYWEIRNQVHRHHLEGFRMGVQLNRL